MPDGDRRFVAVGGAAAGLGRCIGVGLGSQDLLELVGPDGLRSYLEPTAPERGRFDHTLRFALGTTIYAGTSEAHRTVIAQRGLGLPR